MLLDAQLNAAHPTINNKGGDLINQQSSLSSTFKSLDLPPKEYEQQLQQYEFEVRNHIKVEQQLKLHIEVLQDKIEEMEKERDQVKKEQEQALKELENRIRGEVEKL